MRNEFVASPDLWLGVAASLHRSEEGNLFLTAYEIVEQRAELGLQIGRNRWPIAQRQPAEPLGITDLDCG